MMARRGMSTLLVRMPYPRLACGIRPRQSVLQEIGRVAESVPLGYECSRGPSADDAHAHVDACVFQQSLGIKIRLCIYMRGHK